MGLEANYGETPLDGDELDALEPALLTHQNGLPKKYELYDIESSLLHAARRVRLDQVDRGQLTLVELWSAGF